MGDPIEQSMARVITLMHRNLGDQLTIDDMARVAMFSKFHFSRVFRQVTGISPGRFLSAVRLEEAKRLLVSTSLSVADISNMVGYTSVGTFSARFKHSVGLPPTQYRVRGGVRAHDETGKNGGDRRGVVITGRILPPRPSHYGMTFLGLFPDWLPQGRPVRCAVLERPGAYLLDDVPPGTWYLLTQSVPPGGEQMVGDEGEDFSPAVGAVGPITVRPGTTMDPIDVELQDNATLELPILLALLDVRLASLGIIRRSPCDRADREMAAARR
jgi:AraC-like DNA-binding protein